MVYLFFIKNKRLLYSSNQKILTSYKFFYLSGLKYTKKKLLINSPSYYQFFLKKFYFLILLQFYKSTNLFFKNYIILIFFINFFTWLKKHPYINIFYLKNKEVVNFFNEKVRINFLVFFKNNLNYFTYYYSTKFFFLDNYEYNKFSKQEKFFILVPHYFKILRYIKNHF